jgi:putative transposase
VLKENEIQISMNGKGRWRDNVFVERLWKTIKYGEVHLRAYDSVSKAKDRLAKYIDFYNRRRPHKAIGRVPPDYRYYESLPKVQAA